MVIRTTFTLTLRETAASVVNLRNITWLFLFPPFDMWASEKGRQTRSTTSHSCSEVITTLNVLVCSTLVCLKMHNWSLSQVFGNIQLHPDTEINRHNNFQTFVQSLILLFRWVQLRTFASTTFCQSTSNIRQSLLFYHYSSTRFTNINNGHWL